MTFEAKVIEDSIAPHGVRLTTLQLRYPRLIHSEFMTHRVFSRNASSSRAIPVAKVIDQVRSDPAMPVHWGKNQSGMQAREELQGSDLSIAQSLWRQAASEAADTAEAMMTLGLHKQVANRILEPFQWMHVIVTATDWDNFFELRDHEDAEPNIRHLARMMRQVMDESTPVQRDHASLDHSAWHLPYVSAAERDELFDWILLVKVSAARCARVSYLNHDGSSPEIDKDLQLYDRLVGSRPLHASPIEHQGAPLRKADVRSGNFRGWQQFRKFVEARA